MYQIGKRPAKMAYMDTGLKSSLLSSTDWLSKWIDVYLNRHTQMDDPREYHPDLKRNHPKQQQNQDMPTN